MKPTLIVGIACSILLASAAVAQTSAPEPSNQGQAMQANPPSSDGSTSGSSPTPGTKSSDSTAQACEKQATAKKLTGDDKDKWVKDCKAGKKTRQDH
jgi:cytochrome c5